ncbi:MAG: DUF4419 domain-containing protein [Saprospiraceae bacterium]|nr:DUF4419 domain-containing protein [Saprospiraceae bacterium]
MDPKTLWSCLLSAFALLPFQSLTFAQTGAPNTTPEKTATSVTFPVCKVELADTLLAEIPYAEALRRYALPKRESFFVEEENEAAAAPEPVVESCSRKDKMLIEAHFHPFVYAAYRAYSDHRPLTISPDMVWLIIVQGFAMHVNENAEALRKRFVDFDGKTNIDVQRNDFVKGDPNNKWEEVFPEFSYKIGEYTGQTLKDLVVANFSTSGNIEKAAFEVSLMDAMDHYFSYSFSILCGIPEIRLEGTPEDWALIEEKAQQLAQYDLNWWIKDLAPILREFTLAAKGSVNQHFWEDLFKIDYLDVVCGEEPSMTGWMVKFFPYLPGLKGEEDEIAARNPLVGRDIKSFFKKGRSGKKEYMGPKIAGSDFATGLSKAGFIFNDNGRLYKMEFNAGFIGISQDHVTKALRPEMGWAVIDTNQPPSKEEIEQYLKTPKLPKASAGKE